MDINEWDTVSQHRPDQHHQVTVTVISIPHSNGLNDSNSKIIINSLSNNISIITISITKTIQGERSTWLLLFLWAWSVLIRDGHQCGCLSRINIRQQCYAPPLVKAILFSPVHHRRPGQKDFKWTSSKPFASSISTSTSHLSSANSFCC